MSLQTLISNLNHADESERMFAAEDIGYANDRESIAPLVLRLRIEPSCAVKETIISALTRMTHEEVMVEAVGLFESEDASLRNQAVALLTRRGTAAISHLMRAMANPDSNVRKLALDVVGQIRNPETRCILEASLQDIDLNIVITAVEYIGVGQCRELKNRIEELLETATEPMLITALLETLCVVGDKRSLHRVLRSFDPIDQVPEFLQYSVIKLMGELGDVEHGGLLLSMLKVPNLRLCPQILDAFTRIRERNPSVPISLSQQLFLEEYLKEELTDMQRYETLMLLRHCHLDAVVHPEWKTALERLKDPGLRLSLETLDRSSK